MKVRLYQPADRDACLSIFVSNTEAYFDPSELKGFSEFLDKEVHEVRYFVIVVDGVISACGGYYYGDGEAWFNWGMVHKSEHGRGIGLLLLDCRLKDIKALHGVVPIYLATSQHTRGFYEKHGFKVQKVEPNGYAEGLDKVTMVYGGGPPKGDA